ncbi:MAG: GAF and ANTAR domain-containing protein [Actinomycetota bacterium]|nr:GAF and ANTAR domain-containing protein [Actinomycetota bacterium]
MIATERLLDLFVEVADTLVDDFDLIDFLHNVVDHTAAITGAASVGLLLADEHERLQFMAASTDGAKHLELLQLQNSEGPCLDCYRAGQQVVNADLGGAAAQRWRSFAPRATAMGLRSVHAFPLRLRERTIGALNVFGVAPLPLAPDDIHVVQALADVATIAIIQERAIAAAETLTQQLQGALNSRVVIEQAKGVIARSRGVDVEVAFSVLRSHARRQHLRLTDLAHEIATGRTDPDLLGEVGGRAH